MPAKKGERIQAKYDAEKMYALIKEGKSAREIMNELGVKTKPTLMSHLLKLMNEKREFLEISGASTRTRSSSPVCRNGKIVLTANMLAGMGIEDGQKFRLKKTENGLKLVAA